MNKWKTCLYVAVIVALTYWLGRHWCETAFRHRTEIRSMKELVGRIRHCKPDNVREVIIIPSDEASGVRLDSKTDRAEIARLMDSLKRIRVEDRERNIGPASFLIIDLNRPVDNWTRFRIDGDFDPDHAPVITRSMRSDDLGLVIQDILKKKRPGKKK